MTSCCKCACQIFSSLATAAFVTVIYNFSENFTEIIRLPIGNSRVLIGRLVTKIQTASDVLGHHVCNAGAAKDETFVHTMVHAALQTVLSLLSSTQKKIVGPNSKYFSSFR